MVVTCEVNVVSGFSLIVGANVFSTSRLQADKNEVELSAIPPITMPVFLTKSLREILLLGVSGSEDVAPIFFIFIPSELS